MSRSYTTLSSMSLGRINLSMSWNTLDLPEDEHTPTVILIKITVGQIMSVDTETLQRWKMSHCSLNVSPLDAVNSLQQRFLECRCYVAEVVWVGHLGVLGHGLRSLHHLHVEVGVMPREELRRVGHLQDRRLVIGALWAAVRAKVAAPSARTPTGKLLQQQRGVNESGGAQRRLFRLLLLSCSFCAQDVSVPERHVFQHSWEFLFSHLPIGRNVGLCLFGLVLGQVDGV